jgi:hypothetical protein
VRKYRSWEYPWVSTRRKTTPLVFAPQWAVFSQASRTRCLEVSDGDRQNAIERVGAQRNSATDDQHRCRVSRYAFALLDRQGHFPPTQPAHA